MNASIGKRDPAKQKHRTPPAFLDAVQKRFGRILWDLAATEGHEVSLSGCSFTPEENALEQEWSCDPVPWLGTVWLNPPFANIRPWVAKLDAECRNLPRWTLCLVPASMGSKWWADHVLGKCFALGVTRMAFVGEQHPYPKDLALLCFGFGVNGVGFWDWQKDIG